MTNLNKIPQFVENLFNFEFLSGNPCGDYELKHDGSKVCHAGVEVRGRIHQESTHGFFNLLAHV